MNNSVLLYIVNMLSYDVNGFGGVDLASLATWIGCSKPTAQKKMRELCEYGVIREVKKGVPRGHGFRYEYIVTNAGKKALEDDGKIIHFQFKAWQNNKLVGLLESAKKISAPRGKPKKVSDKQKVLL